MLGAAVILVLLGAAPGLGPEQAVDEPVWWPFGGDPHALETPGGALVVASDRYQGVARSMSPDGGLGPVVDLGPAGGFGLIAEDGVRLARTDAGVVVLAVNTLRSTLVSLLLDPATGAPLRPPLVLPMRMQTSPALVLLAPMRGGAVVGFDDFEPDAGLQYWLAELLADGTLSGVRTNVSAYGVPFGLEEGPTGVWATFRGADADGGTETRVSRLLGSLAPGVVAAVPGAPGPMAPTADGVWIATQGSSTDVRVTRLSPLGQVLTEVTLAPTATGWVSGLAAAARGDELWVAAAVGAFPGFEPDVELFRVLPDGGQLTQTVYRGDAGDVSIGGLLAGAAPQVLLTREYPFGRGWRGALRLPLTGTGAAAGPPEPIFLRPAGQRAPAVSASADRIGLAWSDDWQLPRQTYLQGLPLSLDGVPLGPSIAFEARSSQFTNVNPTGRFIASTGAGHLLTTWSGFDVFPVDWRADGGVTLRTELTPQVGVFGPPFLCARDGGYQASWTQTGSTIIRRTDTRGVAVEAAFSLGAVFLADLREDGAGGCLAALGEGTAVRLLRLGASGAPQDGGVVVTAGGPVTGARLASWGAATLVAWSASVDAGVVEVGLQPVDSATLAPVWPAAVVSSLPTESSYRVLTDVAARGEVLSLFGVAVSDGGTRGWLLRVRADGGVVDPSPVFPASLEGVGAIVAGPTLPDGGLFIAYDRLHPELFPQAWRVHFRTVGEAVETGGACTVDDECDSRRCVEGVCQDAVDPGGPQVYQVRCGCDALGGLGPLAALALLGWRRRRRWWSPPRRALTARRAPPSARTRCPASPPPGAPGGRGALR